MPGQMIVDQLLNGYGTPAITTPVVGNYRTGFAVTEGFNTALQPYGFNLTKSRELLRAAGYFPNQPPVVSFTLTPTSPVAGQTVYFNATASYDPDGTITSYAWDFGDSQTGYGATTTHAFASPGTYQVTLTATDNGLAISSVSNNVTVSYFSLSTPSPSTLTVVQGSDSPSASITATLVSGTTTPIVFSASNLPAGVIAAFSNSQCSSTCTVKVTFSAAATAVLGTVTVSINASGEGASQATSLSLSVIAIGKISPAVTISCSPSSVNVGRFTTCSVTVTGSYPSGAVTFATSSSTGVFTPENGMCTLSTGVCSVTYADTASASLTAVITASYTGDNSNTAGSGTFSLGISIPTGTIAVGTTSSTMTNGQVTANQRTVTGSSFTINGSTAANGTPVAVTTQTLSSPSSGVVTPNLTNLNTPSYYDVLVTGITTGNAKVCISFTPASSTTLMLYWSGTVWTRASNITVNGTTICGSIPVSALTGTNIALANPVQQTSTPGTDYTLVYTGVGVAAIIVLAGVFLLLRRRRGLPQVTT